MPFNLELEVLQRDFYYPFGLSMEGAWIAGSTDDPRMDYRYNGKELSQVTGLYAYGARYYDPTLGRFTGVDPIADQFAFVSPFNYAENEPIRHIDLWGLQKYDPNASAPSGILHIGDATLPQGSMVDRSQGISTGDFTLHGVYSDNGNYWQATKYNDDGTWEDAYAVGAGAVGDFIQNSGTYANLNKIRNSAVELGGTSDGLLEAWKSTWNPVNIAFGVSMGGKAFLPVSSPVKASSKTAPTRYVSVYHKGNLNKGQVAGGRSLSTGLDKASVEALKRNGKVYQFDIPENVYNEWISSHKARTITDYDITTGVYNNEVRFHGSISVELNKYIKK